MSHDSFRKRSFFVSRHRYIRRRDLHTVLPKHTMASLNQGQRLSKMNSVDDKTEGTMSSHLKRAKSNSVSSETGIGNDSDSETNVKRAKLEQIDEVNQESSPKTSEFRAATE